MCLWRLRQGEFDGLHPQWVVLAIGTNNLTGTEHARASTPQEIVEGIDAICKEISQRSPETPHHSDGDLSTRREIRRSSASSDPADQQLLAERFAYQPSITFLDIGQQFLAPDGSLPADLFPDGTHPAQAGYQIWGDALIKAGIRP